MEARMAQLQHNQDVAISKLEQVNREWLADMKEHLLAHTKSSGPSREASRRRRSGMPAHS
jgi:hypothetical protein